MTEASAAFSESAFLPTDIQLTSPAEGQDAFPWDPTIKVVEGWQVTTTDSFRWTAILGGILAFFFAWGIGANDVANAFATSVGAGAISLKWACAIAAVFEFLGAFLLGSEVTDTVRKKIVNPDFFNPTESNGALNGPDVFMVGSVVVLFVAGTWLFVATYFEMPVSTTHSVIGAYIGFGFAFRGGGAVIWLSSGTGLDRLKGVVGVVASWLISPVLSGILAVIIFLIVRHTVLRTKHPVRSAFLFAPIFYALTIIVTVFFIIYKGDKRTNAADDLGLGGAFGVAFGTGIAVGLLAWWFLVPPQKRFIERWEANRIAAAKTGPVQEDSKLAVLKKVGINVDYDDTLDDRVQAIHDAAEQFEPKAEQAFAWMQVFTASFDAFSHGANDVANAIAPFSSIFSLYQNGGNLSVTQNYDEFEQDGTFVDGPFADREYKKGDIAPTGQSLCGIVDSVAYYNCETPFGFLTPAPEDVPKLNLPVYEEIQGDDNSTAQLVGGAFTECYGRCHPGGQPAFQGVKQDVPAWILALGGAGIVAGLAMWGYRIILAIGSKLTKITPSRGFSIELGAAITVLIASKLGLPVSTTHCQVGATVGVGVIEGKLDTVNWRQLAIVFAGWVFTVVLTAFSSYLILLFVLSAPVKFDVPQRMSYCPGQQLLALGADNTAHGFVCSGLDGYQSTNDVNGDFADFLGQYEISEIESLPVSP